MPAIGATVAIAALAVSMAIAIDIAVLVVHLRLAGGRVGHGQCRLLAAGRGTIAGLLLGRGAAGHVLLLGFAIRIECVVRVRGELLPGRVLYQFFLQTNRAFTGIDIILCRFVQFLALNQSAFGHTGSMCITIYSKSSERSRILCA